MPCEVLHEEANLFYFTCKLLQGTKLSSDHKSNIIMDTLNSKIEMNQKIITRDGSVARVDLICKKICDATHATKKESKVSNKTQKNKDINSLHIELGHKKKSHKLWEKLMVIN